MNILPLGDCSHAHANEDSHVKGSTIKELTHELHIIKNMPNTEPNAKGEKIKQLLLMKDNLNKCINIVKNDLIRHNSSKLPRLETLLKETNRTLDKNISRLQIGNIGATRREPRAMGCATPHLENGQE